MKKYWILLAALVMTLACTTALAGCSEHPDAGEYEHSFFSHEEQWNENYHICYYYDGILCFACGREISGGDYSYLEPHEFNGGSKCIFCGYVDSGKPTPEALQRLAFQRVTSNPVDILNKTATVVHDGNVRADAGADYEAIGSVLPDETYKIKDYLVVNGDHVWLQIEYGAGDAWVSAGLVSISGGETVKGDADLYIGRTCKIKVSSGRARITPGTDGTVIDYVRYGETYTVLAAEYVADGTLWFQIETSDGACWISSGLVNIR